MRRRAWPGRRWTIRTFLRKHLHRAILLQLVKVGCSTLQARCLSFSFPSWVEEREEHVSDVLIVCIIVTMVRGDVGNVHKYWQCSIITYSSEVAGLYC